ncbi:MAG: DUF3098 domain-containing protein [Candidatus Marinimicrobia bacterium]|jgi:hypothetical protein|nr:DUF3098 domain-containing protein [Candidatus Neomarinimicrobiota bacterium]MCK9483464.1 DUF3098 domain-containing protein [Candidatus Neomarinimicrobiota bacterium]MCK9560520.1 DUF3098 domain-containing protein [Candidatus Neomarinimicrobiota bacterium]MDD5061313.1 DUF3098 domain-containing protein [Candidatus Neomarinimicrobiota bacterium]MDD5230501.1 DUF3098 domain-containing protein [Candidatus Neomarinimicrobiota bacterium]
MVKVKTIKKSASFISSLSLTKINYIIFAIGMAVILAGYICMASGDTSSFRSLTLAPIVLLIGYLVIIPLAILYRKKEDNLPKEN